MTLNKREFISVATQAALDEIEKNGSPSVVNFETANREGQRLAEELGIDKETVLLGTILMDLKHGEAKKQNKLDDHVDMSAEAADNLMIEYNLDEDTRKIVKNCILGHHGNVTFQTKEAEVVMNADCYRFLLPRNVLLFIHEMMSDGKSIEDAVAFAASKVEEKKALVSLDITKEELSQNYTDLMAVLNKI